MKPTKTPHYDYNDSISYENDYDRDSYEGDMYVDGTYVDDCYDNDDDYSCQPVLEKSPMVV